MSDIASALNCAAADGPASLLQELDAALAANPGLAANPDSATGLARAAAAPVPSLVGATLPIYRAIGEKIANAAPAERRAAVEEAVSTELMRLAETDPRAEPILPTWEPGQIATGQPEPISLGYNLGSFTIYPDIKSGFFYDDNIFATRDSHQSAWVATVSPRIAVQSNWARHQLVAEAQGDFTRYTQHTAEDTNDWQTSVDGRIDAAQTTQILLGGLAYREHEDRASPDAVEGFTPTPYTSLNTYAGVAHRIDAYTVRFGTTFENLTFGNVDGQNGEIDNQDRNRNRVEVGGLVRYEQNTAFRPYVEAYGVFHSYQRQFDDFGFERSSQGATTGVGALWRIADNLSGETFIGVLTRNYDDPTFKTHTTPAANATIRWEPTDGTAAVLFFDRSLEETTLPGSPGYDFSIVGGRVEQALTDKLTGILRAAVSRSAFVQNARIDDEGDFSAGLRYALTQIITVGGDYRYTARSSNNSTADFGRNQFFLKLNAAF